MGEITKRDKPRQQTFIDTFVPAPFDEFAALGQQLAKEKSQKRADLRDISDSLLGIKSTEEDRGTRDRIIGDFKARISEISKSPARNQDAEIQQLADSIGHEVNFGNLAQISTNFTTEIESRKQEVKLRTSDGGKLFDEDFSLSPIRKAFETTYGNKKRFIQDSSNLDEEGNVKIRPATLPRAHHNVNKHFDPIFDNIKADLRQTAIEDKERGLITTTKTGGITDKRIYGAAFNQVVEDLIPPFMLEQLRTTVGEKSQATVERMAKRAIENLPPVPGQPSIVFETLSPEEVLELAIVDRVAKVGHDRIYSTRLASKKNFGGGGMRFSGRGRVSTENFNFTAKIIRGPSKDDPIIPLIQDPLAFPQLQLLPEVDEWQEVLISKTGKGGTGKNQVISVQDPDNREQTLDVRPKSFRRQVGGDDWFLFTERSVDLGAQIDSAVSSLMRRDNLTKKEAVEIIGKEEGLTSAEIKLLGAGKKASRTVEELYSLDQVKENFGNNYDNIFLEDLEPNRLFDELGTSGRAATQSSGTSTPKPVVTQPTAKEPITLSGNIDVNELILDQIYTVNGRTGRWSGTNLVPVK